MTTTSAPTRVTVTGTAGQIAYSLLFRIAAGDLLGPDRPVALRLLEIEPSMPALEGVLMELSDSAFGLLDSVTATTDPEVAFDGAELAFLVGSMPRKPGQVRADLLAANAPIFVEQGRALDAAASRDVKVLVVGNPANTNALVAQQHAPGLDPRAFSALTRLDHNRALGLVAERAGCGVGDVERVTIWGNHSDTQVPDLTHATVAGAPALDRVGAEWWASTGVPRVQKRGAEIIAARGASSAASAASAALDHVRDWVLGTPAGDWTSMAVVSDGSYGVPEGLVSSFPVTCRDGQWTIVEDLEVDEATRGAIAASITELEQERAAALG